MTSRKISGCLSRTSISGTLRGRNIPVRSCGRGLARNTCPSSAGRSGTPDRRTGTPCMRPAGRHSPSFASACTTTDSRTTPCLPGTRTPRVSGSTSSTPPTGTWSDIARNPAVDFPAAAWQSAEYVKISVGFLCAAGLSGASYSLYFDDFLLDTGAEDGDRDGLSDLEEE